LGISPIGLARTSHGLFVIIAVDPRSPTPPYEQIRISIRRLVATGELSLGSRLPTVRQLASDLGLAPGTIARAFRELESEGIIETRGRHGTRVKSTPPVPRRAEGDRRIRDAAAQYAAVAAELAIDSETAVDHVRQALNLFV
jgi:DNA-binding transcriptional regulator YhcF (GntR family)